jgi:hypothetical protein
LLICILCHYHSSIFELRGNGGIYLKYIKQRVSSPTFRELLKTNYFTELSNKNKDELTELSILYKEN